MRSSRRRRPTRSATARCGSPTSVRSCASARGSGTPTPSEDLDAWLASLLGNERDASLVAVGSLGRRDRAPHSDLDLVLLHRSRRDIKDVAERIWYPIWDRGLGLDYSVRTVKETLSTAEGDMRVALGLLDARHLAGDPRLTADLTQRLRALWHKRAKKWLPLVREATVERHEHFGEVAFLLEPELKEGRGGLRDVGVLRAVQQVTTILGDLLPALDEPHARLQRVRSALHERTGRALDRLLLQEQDGVAVALGMDGADALLAEVSSSARTITFVGDDCWRRVAGWLGQRRSSSSSGGAAATGGDRPLGPSLSLRDGEVHAYDSNHWLAAAAAAAELHVPLDRATLQRFADEVPAAPDPWPFGWRQSFVALLGAGRGAVPVLEALDHFGLLVRLLPEWEAVRFEPQRNAYHRFTVDRHLMEAVARAAALTRRVARPDLLLLGALLHDVGKGFAGDHTEAGVRVVAGIAPRMGLAPADAAVLVAMVQHHLLLPDTATRRDIDDPSTVAAVASAVGDRGTLELLHALTEADSLATGPAAWSDWKAALVARLVERVEDVLAGRGPPEPRVGDLLPNDVADGLHVLGDGRCAFVADDQRGLLSRVAGVLAVNGLEVHGATAGALDDGRAIEVFEVAHAFGAEPDWDAVRRDLAAAEGGAFALEERLAQRARAYMRRASTQLAAPTVVLFDNDASDRATIVEVRARDAVGLLYRVTKAIAESGLDVRSARASTLGHEVVDAFYVVDRDGTKVTSAARLAALEERILYEVRST